eukprot:scaffold494975_cov56-Prasinocladus_malaysianus.AAC.1
MIAALDEFIMLVICPFEDPILTMNGTLCSQMRDYCKEGCMASTPFDGAPLPFISLYEHFGRRGEANRHRSSMHC